VKELKPGYVNISINGNTLQDRKTTHNAVKFRISQEIKFSYRKKQHLNQQLYQLHLEGALQNKSMWQRALDYIDEQINRFMENKHLILHWCK
jgi:hypothetical protein